MSRLLKLLGLAAFTLFSSLAQAGWYTAQGSAAVLGSMSEAREAAIQDAVRNAILEAGGNISIATEMENGSLVNTKMQLNSPVRHVTVLEEQRTSSTYNVVCKVLIDNHQVSKQQCSGSRIKKSILPIGFRFVDPQAYQGSAGIETINRELDRLIYGRLSTNKGLMVKPVSPSNLRMPNTANSNVDEQRQIIKSLARNNEAQFVLIGNISSTALSTVGNNIVTQYLYAKTRNLEFSLTLIDSITGLEIFNHTYQGTADWTFKQGDFVDLRSDRFLGSPYGQRVRALCDRAVTDLMQHLTCLAPSARVIELEGDEFVINLGRDSGLEKGLEFTLEQSYEGRDRYGQYYEKLEAAPGNYKVVEVFPHAARLRPVSLQDNVLNVQLDDIVTLH
ncbi:MAG: flagella assembly protein FlgT [Succinivibrio sp.]|nr:flagella assembly protein FlgT [Succinivibrio sp.]